MADDKYYELVGVDDQDANSPYILTVFLPHRSITFAVHDVKVTDYEIEAYGAHGEVVTKFHNNLLFGMQPRKWSRGLTSAEYYERALEDAQTDKMRRERAEGILKSKEDKRDAY